MKKLRPLLLSIGLFILTLCITSAQKKAILVSGNVYEEASTKVLSGIEVSVKGSDKKTYTDQLGYFLIKMDSDEDSLVFSHPNYENKTIKIFDQFNLTIHLKAKIIKDSKSDEIEISEIADIDIPEEFDEETIDNMYTYQKPPVGYTSGIRIRGVSSISPIQKSNTESYAHVSENDFKQVAMNPLSTFSVDVDRASYSNIRRILNSGNLPPTDAVRVEEMINYFDYKYPQPTGKAPFSINHELSNCPWNQNNLLLKIGLQGKKMDRKDLPNSNIVFLLDVSGSMNSPNKLPLLKSSLKMLVNNLTYKDKVAIVVYAGNSGLVLPSTKCDEKQIILDALDKLHAGGSTAGGEGLKLAYKVAGENYIKGANNRIILATDGDFNVGLQSNQEMEKLITEEREKGIAISVLGFGMGNYKDDKMELIADRGNGNYAYIDNLQEAQKVLVSEFGGTMFTIAKDVKFQLEFNPKYVAEYRLIGYENRQLNNEDFDNDKKDAGEMGAGHSVTALYEIVPTKGRNKKSTLKYQSGELTEQAKNSKELITLKLRYKEPDQEESKLIETIVSNVLTPLNDTSTDFKFTASIAEFGMLLKESKYKGTSTYESVIELATDGKGKDIDGYRGEMIRLVKLAKSIKVN